MLQHKALSYDVIKRDGEYVLTGDGVPLRTPEGVEIVHAGPRLPEYILHQLYSGADAGPEVALFMALFGLLQQSASLRGGGARAPAVLAADPFIDKLAFERALGKAADQACLVELMEHPAQGAALFNGITNATRIVNRWLIEISEGRVDLANKTPAGILPYVEAAVAGLNEAESVVARGLCARHACGLVLPILLVKRRIGALEYVNALLGLHPPQQAGHPREPGWHRNQLGLPESFAPRLPDWDRLDESRARLLREVGIALDFYVCADVEHAAGPALEEVIRGGESFQVEFKTTLRWNIKAEKKDSAIEHAALKTINAFLNSSGGTLLIGVRDDGTAAGLDLDAFADEDRYALHFWNLVKSGMGQHNSPFIRATFEDWQGKRVFCVRCVAGSHPVFLQHKTPEEEFYIRVGPASARLNIREALAYIAERFGEQDHQPAKI